MLGASILLSMAGGQSLLQVPVATVAARVVLTVTGGALLLGALAGFVKLRKRLV
jgi:hypothetical protein